VTTFIEIIGFINTYFIKGIFVSVIVIILTNKLFKNNFDTKNAVSIIRWVLLSYSILILVYFLLLIFLPVNSDIYSSSFRERAMGPYKFAFWLVTLGSILPLILFFKNLGNNVYFILAITILMNLGWLFESFVIHLTSMEREYVGKVNGVKAYLPFNRELMIVLQGLLLGILTMVIGNLSFLRKNTSR